ncbi:MAG: glycine betaine ABC transporter substrate-binding protein [Alphaproteobacteria bacterium]
MSDRETLHQFLHEHAHALMLRSAEHLELTGIALAAAFVAGVALAMLAFRRRALAVPILAATGMLQTVPGIALLVMTMALFARIGTLPALVALFLYALLPIVQNTLAGLASLPEALAEAARALGLTPWQRLRIVRLPLAMPVIMAGLRTAAVQTVGLATLAAFVGAGGLGQFINRGLFLSDTRLVLLGAVPAALMALLIYGLLSLFAMASAPQRPRRERRGWLAAALAGLAVLVVFTGYGLAQEGNAAPGVSIAVGSKNFTEQLIVAEMVAQQIERTTHLPVARHFGLGGSSVMHEALAKGEIDVAVEYTGTALAGILHLPVPASRAAVFPTVRDAYAARYGLVWLKPLGFDNSYELAVREGDPRLAGVTTISALSGVAPRLTAAFDFEFAERADGYRGLQQRYGLQFGRVLDMHPDLLYPALRKGTVDVISAYATDGRLARPDIRTLRDDAHFFPPYEAAVVVRRQALEAHPELKAALSALSGRLDNDRMRALNEAVDSGRLSVEQAAAQALGK